MAKQTIAFKITMAIELPEGDTEVTQVEKDNIAERIQSYLIENGTTSDEYEGHLAGEFANGRFWPELSIDELPVAPKVIVNVSGGVAQGARTNLNGLKIEIFDEDNLLEEGMTQADIDSKWEKVQIELPFGIL